jgi:murein DD-endopeptidase MepM/ murein hydrolase activator NlpD
MAAHLGNVSIAAGGSAEAHAQRQARLYSSAVRLGGGMTMERVQEAAFSALERTGGMHYAGQAAVMAQQQVNYGVDPTGRFGQQAIRLGGNASALLGLNPESAQQSALQLSSGAGSANMMRQLGIYTSDPSTGEQLSTTQIIDQIKSRLYTGRGPLTEEAVNESFYRGALGASLNGLGLDQNMQEMVRASLIADAGGKKMDLTNTSSTKDLAAQNPDMNPSLPYGQMAAADEQLMDASTTAYTESLGFAADAATNFANVVTWALKTIPGADIPLRLNYAGATAAASSAGKSVLKLLGMGGDGSSLSLGTRTAAAGGASVGAAALGMGDNASRNAEGTRTSAATSTSDSTGKSAASSWSMPTAGEISSPYGMRLHKLTGTRRMHRGTDIAAPAGTPIVAIDSGVAVTVSTNPNQSFGKHVRIDHQNGYRSLYAHMSQTLVAQGAKVKKGQLIGKVGTTGDSTGNHLHIEITKDGAHLDPMNVLTGASSVSGESAEAAEAPNTTEKGLPATSTVSGSGLLPINQDLSLLSTEFIQGDSMLSFTRDASRRNEGGSGDFLNLGTRTGSRRSPSTYMPGMPRAKDGDSYVAQDGPVNVHAGEAILNEQDAQAWRDSQRGLSKGGGATVNINVTVMQASESEARRLAAMTKEYIHEDELMARIGSR